jgi:tetratricopeptide (TPR) repeat protein
MPVRCEQERGFVVDPVETYTASFRAVRETAARTAADSTRIGGHSGSDMANESTAATPAPADPTQSPSWAALSDGDRSRLIKCYRTGVANAANPQYAIDMFSICVSGDPGNVVFLQAFLAALRKKFGVKKSGGLGSLFSAGSRVGLKRLAAAAKWRELLAQGVDILKGNPSDHGCLLAMAEACGNLMFFDCQAVYLRAALDSAPTDAEVNRQCARFAASQGNFDQAIECWRRIAKIKGLAEEAEKAIAELSVDKTIAAGQGRGGRPGMMKASAAPDDAAQAKGASPRAVLEQKIRDNPTDIDAYLELADLVERETSADEAEKVLAKALAASGNDIKVREHIEDRQLRWARGRILIAEKRLAADDSDEHRATLEKLKTAQLRQEIEVFAARTSRYPENLTWKYELALRLKAAGKFPEAIRSFQEAMQDTRRKGVIALELGECFQSIKQYQLAMQNYELAVETLTDREIDLRKRALYRAGVLATGLKDVDGAMKHLSAVASLDFGYRDVAQRLDKLRSASDNSPSET